MEEQLRKINMFIYLMYYNQSINEQFLKASMLKYASFDKDIHCGTL